MTDRVYSVSGTFSPEYETCAQPALPLTVEVGREGDALARAGLYAQSVNPFSFYHPNQLTVIFGGRAPYILRS
ncbi:hypothetical protein B9Y20_06370 [Acinetobacter baumannii]|nr:hypothetical protein B9X43_06170 [Acinetobacter baumannii]POV76883.1 hypothetical protein C3422_04490 [Acinetobacter sp. ABNIH27]OTN10001.1 hypothetical protein B9Y20_06370 [Acinetobacter baumannii]OTS63954.1 hypothetical protein CAS98_10355 [Acinetobacter baumannii]OTT23510.1 hypothetical protein CAS85_02275 [Acinetobacter baumannii]